MTYLIGYIFIVFLSLIKSKNLNFKYLLIFIFLVIFIGLRHEVGADWFQYMTHLYSDPIEYLRDRPGYFLITSLVQKYNWGIYGINLLTAAIFSFGLIYFCRNLRNPNFALISSYPYFIVVVAMGLVTQSCSLGFEMIGLTFYQKKNLLGFIVMISIASTFHNTSLVLLSIPLIDNLLSLKKKAILISCLLIIPLAYFVPLYYSFMLGEYEYFFRTGYGALGATIKVLIPFGFSLFYLTNKKFFAFNPQENKLYTAISINLLFLIIYTFSTVTTAAAYRLSLYFYPIIFVISSALSESTILNISKKYWQSIIISYNFFILFIWVNFSYHSFHWIPYKNLLFL